MTNDINIRYSRATLHILDTDY